MEIQQKGGLFVVPCREWAAVHLGKDITYAYRNKRNALRAATDPKRNTVTTLCYYSQQLFERVAVLETLLLRIKQISGRYDFDEPDDAGSTIGDGGLSNGINSGAAADDTGSGKSTCGTEGAAGSSGGGDEGTDGSN
jgi:hypothetical protein